MSKKFATITATALATIGAIATAAVVLYKKGYLTIEVEEEPETETEDEVLEEAKLEAVEPEIVASAPKKRETPKKKITKE